MKFRFDKRRGRQGKRVRITNWGNTKLEEEVINHAALTFTIKRGRSEAGRRRAAGQPAGGAIRRFTIR
jgi:hypothetical protein